ncbi:hypothetical protein H9I52_02735 [Hymenobacter sp. BT491]|nr:hypothetical protein [Hymenobacter sp. BT491]
MTKNPSAGYSPNHIKVPLQDDNVYALTCSQGHESLIILRNPKCEWLFESGILALKDGYYREAVTSFAASLERFYEYLITALTITERKADPEGFQRVWKSMVNQSERQIGAVNFLFFKCLGKPMSSLDKAFLDTHGLSLGKREPVNFRNVVVHQGFIPDRQAAIHYGEAIYKYIRQVLTGISSITLWKQNLLEATNLALEKSRDAFGKVATSVQTESFFLDTTSCILSTDSGPSFGGVLFAPERSLIEYMGE